MKNEVEELCTDEKKNKEIKFSVEFKEDGASFQSIMEQILINKIINK